MENINNYSDESIKVLENLEAVRKRPGMYIGNTTQNGLHHLVWEIVDNAVDEALAGYCNTISVKLTKNHEIEVKDNGRGIPTGVNSKTKKSTIETVFTVLHAGGKFDNDTYKVSGGLHGVGASVVNALSEWLEVTVYRNDKKYYLRFENGGKPSTGLIVEENLENEKGTRVFFKPDASIFLETTIFQAEILVNRIKELAFLNKGIKFIFYNEIEEKKNEFYYQGGIKEYIQEINKNSQILTDHIFYLEDMKDKINIEISFQYLISDQIKISSFCNNIKTYEGGTHEEGFKTGITRVISDYAKKNNFIKSSDLTIIGDDVREGLVAIVSIKHPNPIYEGQTKGKLANSEVKGIVYSSFVKYFSIFLEENPAIAKKIIEKIIISAKARIEAKKARELVKRKSSLEFTTLPGKLADCSSKNIEETELYIVEGDSAGGSAKLGRDRNFQAILPIKGKVINVEKASLEKIFNNDEISNMITALGCGIDENIDLAKLRYNKLMIMTDADVDGAHIRILLLTFLFTHMKQLIEKGHVYIAQPPLYKFEVDKKAYYFFNQEDLEKAKKLNENKKYNIQRYKGLGEMNPTQLWETTMDPASRTILKVKVEDETYTKEQFKALMGEDVSARKNFIRENAHYIKDIEV